MIVAALEGAVSYRKTCMLSDINKISIYTSRAFLNFLEDART